MFLSINKFGGVPMYESLVARVQEKGTDAVFLSLKAAWLECYDSEIVVKTKSKLDTEKERVRKKFREKRNQLNKQPVFDNYFQPDPKINYDYEKQSGKKVRDQSSREKQKTDFQKLREQQELNKQELNKQEQQELNALSYSHYYTKIEAEFIQKFEDYFWFKGENFKQKCNQQIKQLDLKEVLNNFFARHGWLKTQGNDYVAEKFLGTFLTDKLLNGLKISSNRPYAFSATLSCEIDKDQLKKMIEGYPYTNTNFYTAINYRDTFSTQLDDGKPIVNHVLKRIDAIRFLLNSCGSLSIRCQDSVVIPEYAAFHINEFRFFSESQWLYFKTLFININTEDDPLWILLNKEEKGKWAAYVDNNNPIKTEVAQIFEKQCIRIEQVDSQYNYYGSDIEGLTNKTRWHAVLFGRVFLACYDERPVESYRSHVPVSYLLQDTLAKCVEPGSYKSKYINRAFINRKPFSSLTVDKTLPVARDLAISTMKKVDGHRVLKTSTIEELNNSRYENDKIAILLNTWNDLEINSSQRIINKFDERKFNLNYEANNTTLTIESIISNASELIEALQVVYHSKVSQLVLSCEKNVMHSQEFSIVEQLFDYDIYLRSVLLLEDDANYLGGFSKPLHCAARNRFLANYSPNTLNTADNIKVRKRLWDITGEKITHFFANNDAEFNLDFIKEVSSFDKDWRDNGCDDHSKTKLKDSSLWPTAWSFVQIAQMGNEGLASFFNHIEKYYYATAWDPMDPKSPNLHCTFDLNGGLSDEPELYINFLTAKLRSLKASKNKCSPLFKSLSLIMPNKLSDKVQDAFLSLLSELNNRKEHLPKEIDKVVLYDLEISSINTPKLLTKLKSMADKGLQILIELPEWDRNTYEKMELRKIKATYRQIQNKILDNQRLLRQLDLKKNTQLIHDCAKDVLRSDVIIEEKLAQKEQDWAGDDVRYPLAAQVPGIQQQLQQEVTQEFQQEQEQEQEEEQEQEQEQEIALYSGDISSLIDRNNIDAKYKDSWFEIPESVKTLSGWEGEKLSQLFSLWVGSQENATHVIEKIHPQAIQEIMNYAPQFRLGLSKDNLPAGFYLTYLEKDKGLVLCFDKKRQRQDLEAIDSLSLKKRNPFTVKFHQASLSNTFRGDFRQFLSTLAAESFYDALTLWKFLALEAKDSKRLNDAKIKLDELGLQVPPEDISVILPYLDVTQKNEVPQIGDFKQCLSILKAWANTHQSISPDLINDLFNEKSTSHLTEQNLSALGQLFYFYDIDKPQHENQGSEHFLMLADQIYQTYGKEHFSIWKKRFLDCSLNWSELLHESEIKAYSLSIVTLKNHEILQAIWWQLVDAHGEATGHMRYADLWYAFEKIIKFVEEKNLKINKKALFSYLETHKDFHAQVFLDRLYRVLKKANTQVEADKIQQAILDHIEQIDWRHNGFYYANQYDNYFYWDEATQLTQLKSSVKEAEKNYDVKWDSADSIESADLHALRFASQRISFSYSDFYQFKSHLSAGLGSIENPNNSLAIARLYTASLAIGVESLESYPAEKIQEIFTDLNTIDPNVLNLLNQKLSLDDQLKTGTLRIHFAHLSLFLNTIVEQQLVSYLTGLSCENSIAFINSCGRAIEYYECYKGDTETFTKLLQYVLLRNGQFEETKSLPALLTDYPWLLETFVNDNTLSNPFELKIDTFPLAVEHQLSLFRRQLRSINFSKKGFLPDYRMLTKSFETIVQHSDPAQGRREVIDQWLEKGCAITEQDAAFRLLDKQDSEKIKHRLEKYFKEGFKAYNLALLEKLSPYLAVESDFEGDSQLNELLDLFIQLDNKKYYNEVGQVLGLLLQKVKSDDSSRYYSVPQLSAWIGSFIDKAEISQQHYPLNLLNEILISGVENPESSLLNSNLNKLKARGDLEQQRLITKIGQSALSNRYKPTLLKLVLQAKCNLNYIKEAEKLLLRLHEAKVDACWLEATSQLIKILADQGDQRSFEIINQLTKTSDKVLKPSDKENKVLVKLWQKSQIFLIKQVQQGIDNDLLRKVTSDPYVQMILTQVIVNGEKEKGYFDSLFKNLCHLNNYSNASALKKLAEYYASEPYPSAELLLELLSDLHKNKHQSIEDVIHHYETIEQAKTINGASKRLYSVTETDKKGLDRVLHGLKRKGQSLLANEEQKQLVNLFYYLNDYCQVTKLESLKMESLKAKLKENVQEVKNATCIVDQHQASARVLACMREILLRKTGKWVNHTQMLDLTYAALHNQESLLHQVRTGQGKSIITIMRASYLALTGFVVDVFSAKDSLSERDHEEFSPVLDAMGIEHAYITENKSADTYKIRSHTTGVGAVNYATLGNFSLFLSRHTWQGENVIDLNKQRRVAFLDESDHVLLDERTQFNYSDSQGSDAIYNMDEWVYRVAYDFYLKHQDDFINEGGRLYVTRHKHLRLLCESLQDALKQCPKESTFFQKYIIPSLGNQLEAIEKRDQKLKQLLVAAHTAHGLKEGVEFCIRPESKILMGNFYVPTRFAKVIIANQIRHGSTYSDLVQQFLHVRLNKEAASSGEIPNFFVEPCTEIALSQNAKYVLKNYYAKLEGCTGTAGNEFDLKRYEETFNIQHVVKLPSHEVNQTEFLATQFCQSEDEQIQALQDNIVKHRDQPILITCKDDIEVRKIAKKIKNKLELFPDYELKNFIIDTNDSGKPESEIVPFAGRDGAVVISSRMGRGTDIKPNSPKGLIVLRTYPAHTRVTKQEYGRQGRNGAAGSCQDIFNLKTIGERYDNLSKSHSLRLEEIYQQQSSHLDEKLKKHAHTNPNKFEYLNEPSQRECYIKTRTLVQLDEEIKLEKDKWLRTKEYLVCSMTGNIMEHLRECIGGKGLSDHSSLCSDWLAARKEIEAHWNARLTGKDCDNLEVYRNFFEQAANCWKTLCNRYSSLNSGLLLDLDPSEQEDKSLQISDVIPESTKVTKPTGVIEKDSSAKVAGFDEKQGSANQVVINFYQQWLQASAHYVFNDPEIKNQLVNAIYGDKTQYLSKFYQALAFQSPTQHQIQLFEGLTEIVKSPSVHNVSCCALATLIILVNNQEQTHFIKAAEQFFNQSWLNEKKLSQHSIEDIEKNDALFKLTLNIMNVFYVENNSLVFIDHFTQAIHKNFWEEWPNVALINHVFAASPAITKLLTLHTNESDIAYIISLLRDFDCSESQMTFKEARLTQLINYLEKNSEKLGDMPGAIRPWFKLILNGTFDERLTDNLPEPSCLPQLSSRHQSLYWNFLNQRLPIVEAEYEELTRLLVDYKEDENFIKHIYEPLVSLPPHIPLSYINKQLQFSLGKNFFEEARKNLETLRETATTFNEFLYENKIISSAKKFEKPLDETAYKDYLKCFEKFNLEQNQMFFKLAKKYPQISTLTRSIIAAYFSRNSLKTRIELEETFSLCQKISELGLNQSSSFEFLCLAQLYSNENDKIISRLHGFVNAIKHFYITDEESIRTIFLLWVKSDRDLPWLLNSFEVLQSITKFSIKYTDREFLNTYLEDIKEEKLLNRYQEFFKFINKNDDPNLEDYFPKLVSAYFIEKTIKNVAELSNYVEIWREIEHVNENSNIDICENFKSVCPSDDVIKRYKDFFAISKQYENGLPKDMIVSLLRSYINDKNFHKEALLESFAVNEGIYRLLKSKNVHYLYHDNNFLDIYLKNAKAGKTSEYYQQFIDFFSETRNVDLNDNFNNLFVAYFSHRTINTTVELSRHAEVWRKINRFSPQWNVDIFDINDKFYMDCTYSDTSERYLQFFGLVEQYEKEELPDTAVVMLAKAYLQDEKISNEKELQEAFAALCEANKLRNNNNYADYFYDFNGLYQTKRQHIMQYLHHDLLNLGDEFTERCWKNYIDLIQRQLGDNISKRIFNAKVSRSVLHQAFKKMIIVLSELELVAKSPISTSVDVVDDVAPSKNKLVEHQHYFSSLYSSYKGCWFKSQERKRQAEGLFSFFEPLSNDAMTSISQYYIDSFNKICETQQLILESDKQTTRNNKGYSRLYDITVKMFLTLACDCLTDANLSLVNKTELKNLLQSQLNFQINLLRERLLERPKWQTLAIQIPQGMEWHPGSVELKVLNRFFQEHSDNIPKHLRYLVENINNLTQLSNSEPFEKENIDSRVSLRSF